MTAMTGGEDVLRELCSLFTRLDPPTPRLVEQARLAYTWRTVDAELAELSFDSLVDCDAMLAVRAGGDPAQEPRMLGFGAVVDGEDLAIEVEVTTGPGRPVLVGQLLPARATTVEVQDGNGLAGEVAADELGRFLVEPVPSGPVRLRVRHGGHTVQTTWVSYVGG